MPEVFADAENVPAGHVEQCPAAVATVPVGSYLPAGHAWQATYKCAAAGSEHSSRIQGFKATGTIGTPSARTHQDEKRAGAQRVTWQVFTTALEFNVTVP